MISFAERGLSRYLSVLLNAQREKAVTRDEKFYLSLRRAAELRFEPVEKEAREEIRVLRRELSRNRRAIVLEDYGTGRSHNRRSVAAILRTSAIPHHWGMFIFCCVREWKPRHVLELGTNLGVSACYIRAAMDLNKNEGRLMTIEGDPTLAMLARENIARISNGIADVVHGRFEDMLPAALDSLTSVDLVFIDGHHDEQPTYRYFQSIKPYLAGDAVVVFDDVYLWSRPVRRAWKRIITEEHDAIAIDLAKLGILKFNHMESHVKSDSESGTPTSI